MAEKKPRRGSYKTALRAKGIRPIPPHHKLRSFKIGDQAITASEPEGSDVRT